VLEISGGRIKSATANIDDRGVELDNIEARAPIVSALAGRRSRSVCYVFVLPLVCVRLGGRGTTSVWCVLFVRLRRPMCCAVSSPASLVCVVFARQRRHTQLRITFACPVFARRLSRSYEPDDDVDDALCICGPPRA
jgi:hypothetical protein